MSLSTAPAQIRGEVEDGMPHLAYYDRAPRLSFVWTGDLADPIHVQPGGYGEPTLALIDPAPHYPGPHESPADLFAWFRGVCDTWNAAWDGDEDALR